MSKVNFCLVNQIPSTGSLYLRLEALDLPSNKKFAIEHCCITDQQNTIYDLFTPSDGICHNDFIELLVTPEIDGHNVRIEHLLFLQNLALIY